VAPSTADETLLNSEPLDVQEEPLIVRLAELAHNMLPLLYLLNEAEGFTIQVTSDWHREIS